MEYWLDWRRNRFNGFFDEYDQIPEPNLSCKNCAYSEQYAKLVCNPVKVDNEDSGQSFLGHLQIPLLIRDDFIDSQSIYNKGQLASFFLNIQLPSI